MCVGVRSTAETVRVRTIFASHTDFASPAATLPLLPLKLFNSPTAKQLTFSKMPVNITERMGAIIFEFRE